ncbi:MAG TPA: cation:proton antiporter [Gaiellaceae bacterium]|jgi:cell volume regulation protein A|nr:cation:proton antiporter [Gaiellaceae bacterium]
MTEITDYAAILLALGTGVALAVVSTRLTAWVPIPSPVLFLLAAAVVSDLWPHLYEDVPVLTVERIAVAALIVILFNGGMDIGWRRMRTAIGPILSLGILGTFATAAIVAVFAHYALGFEWITAGVIGAALSPTDPAVMFSVLGSKEIEGRSGVTLEGEAGFNDPAGIALMIGMIELATHDGASRGVIVREFAVEMGIGAALGILGALAMALLLGKLTLPAPALGPVLALALAAALYGVTALAHGSGFLAVFIAGLVLGDTHGPYKAEIERFHGALAVLAEISVFVVLGLVVSIGALTLDVWVDGALLVAALALLARPLVVTASLAPFKFDLGERVFIAWCGLKGAVPILLAAFAVLRGVEESRTVFDIVFVVVLLSVAVQGTLVPWVARRLSVPMREVESRG